MVLKWLILIILLSLFLILFLPKNKIKVLNNLINYLKKKNIKFQNKSKFYIHKTNLTKIEAIDNKYHIKEILYPLSKNTLISTIRFHQIYKSK